MMSKRREGKADRGPHASIKLTGTAHHLLKMLSAWLNVDQKGLVQQMLLRCLDEQNAPLKKTISEWMVERHGLNWREELTAKDS